MSEKTEDVFLISLILFSFIMGLLFAFLLLKVSSREFGKPKGGYEAQNYGEVLESQVRSQLIE